MTSFHGSIHYETGYFFLSVDLLFIYFLSLDYCFIVRTLDGSSNNVTFCFVTKFRKEKENTNTKLGSKKPVVHGQKYK